MRSRVHNEDLTPPSSRGLGVLRPSSKDEPGSWRNFYIGAGVIGVIAAVGAVVLATKPSPAKPAGVGLTVAPRCTSYQITDPMRLRNALRQQITMSVKQGPVEPFAETTKFLNKRFKCVSYPNPSRSPAEAELYMVVFKMVTNIMEQELLASAEQRKTYDSMVDTWASSQGVPSTAPSTAPAEGDAAGDVPLS